MILKVYKEIDNIMSQNIKRLGTGEGRVSPERLLTKPLRVPTS
jgi:hypothetical protein